MLIALKKYQKQNERYKEHFDKAKLTRLGTITILSI